MTYRPARNWNGYRPAPVMSRIAGPLIKHAEFMARKDTKQKKSKGDTE